jgi:hypothetical protein
MNDAHIKQGDLVIGNRDASKSVFSSTGRRITDGVFSVGSTETLDEMATQILKNAKLAGVKIEAKAKNKTNKTIKNSKTLTAPRADTAENARSWLTREEPAKPEVKKEMVTFENAFGRMRVVVETVQEHAMAFMLVFSDASQVIFEPKVGESLTFSKNGRDYQVYYPGVIFDWPDREKKAMILFKKEEEA